MRYSTYQNKKLKAIQIEALKAWLMYDFEKMDEYFATDAINMINYIIKLCDSIKTFKTA